MEKITKTTSMKAAATGTTKCTYVLNSREGFPVIMVNEKALVMIRKAMNMGVKSLFFIAKNIETKKFKIIEYIKTLSHRGTAPPSMKFLKKTVYMFLTNGAS